LHRYYVWSLANKASSSEVKKIRDAYQKMIFNVHFKDRSRTGRVSREKEDYALQTMEIINNYRTSMEQVIQGSLIRGTGDIFRGGATGAFDTVLMNLLINRATKYYIENISEKPYNLFKDNMELYAIKDLVTDNPYDADITVKQSANKYLLEAVGALEPKLTSVINTYVKATDRSESDFSWTLPRLFTYIPVVPGIPTLNRLENRMKQDPVITMMNTTQKELDILPFGIKKKYDRKEHEWVKRMERDSQLRLNEAKSIMDTLEKNKSKIRFGGN